jgi:hypothetical protein
MTTPEAPVNVRLIMEDGSEHAVQTVYTGEHRGNHVWRVVDHPPTWSVIGVRAERMPGHTAIAFRF